MTVTLPAALDTEIFVISWLAPIIPASILHDPSDGVPFTKVTRIAGTTDIDTALDTQWIQLDTLIAKPSIGDGIQNRVHERMRELRMQASDAPIEYCTTTLVPCRMDYDNPNIIRYVARYEIGLTHQW